MPESYIPEGYHTVTPYIITKDADGVIDFLKKTFDASIKMEMRSPDGKVGHAEILIGDSHIMISDENELHPPMPSMIYVYTKNVDENYNRAIAAGATSMREPTDEFYGDRSAGVTDASGNQWWIATHKKQVAMSEMQEKFTEMRKEQEAGIKN
jgi:PhnB protein